MTKEEIKEIVNTALELNETAEAVAYEIIDELHMRLNNLK